MSAVDLPKERHAFPWLLLGLMASVTFVGILSELVPSGILPQMTDGLGVSEPQVGLLVGVYALASAIAAIPLISATLAVNRKKLLLALLPSATASTCSSALSRATTSNSTCSERPGDGTAVVAPLDDRTHAGGAGHHPDRASRPVRYDDE